MSGNFPFGFTPATPTIPIGPTAPGRTSQRRRFRWLRHEPTRPDAAATRRDDAARGQPFGVGVAGQLELATDAARKAIVGVGDPSVTDGERSATETAVDLAEVWLDGACQFPATGGRPAAWSRSEWLNATLPAWQSIINPVAERVQGTVSQMLPEAGGDSPALPEGCRRSWHR